MLPPCTVPEARYTKAYRHEAAHPSKLPAHMPTNDARMCSHAREEDQERGGDWGRWIGQTQRKIRIGADVDVHVRVQVR